jgi:hypothetical protein
MPKVHRIDQGLATSAFSKRGVHFAGFKGVRVIGVLGVDVEIENALDLLLPERAAFFKPFQYILSNFKLFGRLCRFETLSCGYIIHAISIKLCLL